MKLGNYEQALQDFNTAERKNFPDICALALSRGIVKRLMKDYEGALHDFRIAYDGLDSTDRVSLLFPSSNGVLNGPSNCCCVSRLEKFVFFLLVLFA